MTDSEWIQWIQLAEAYGFEHGGTGSPSRLMAAIARGEFILKKRQEVVDA